MAVDVGLDQHRDILRDPVKRNGLTKNLRTGDDNQDSGCCYHCLENSLLEITPGQRAHDYHRQEKRQCKAYRRSLGWCENACVDTAKDKRSETNGRRHLDGAFPAHLPRGFLGWRVATKEMCINYGIDNEQAYQKQPGTNACKEQRNHAFFGDEAIDNHWQAWRDQNTESASSGKQAVGEVLIVSALNHFRYCNDPDCGRGGYRNTRYGCKNTT